MNYKTINKREAYKDRFKSGAITIGFWTLVLLFVFFYTFKTTVIKEQEEVSTMLINFGDNRNGNGVEEPANQEGSKAAEANTTIEEEVQSNAIPEKTKTKETPISEPQKTIKKVQKDKILSGNKTPAVAVKNLSKTPSSSKKASQKPSNKKSTSSKSTTSNAKSGKGDGKGNAAIGNLIKGRGTKKGEQGTGAGVGNAGDPLGGDSNGNSRIGVDRKLISFIPGTMGRGGKQPSHQCRTSGKIVVSYTVNKTGAVISARRQSGTKDPCIVSTSLSWVRKYVKAEKANFSSAGTYEIVF